MQIVDLILQFQGIVVASYLPKLHSDGHYVILRSLVLKNFLFTLPFILFSIFLFFLFNKNFHFPFLVLLLLIEWLLLYCGVFVGCSKGRGGHIPYRDSKLTRILQSSLGGNAKTAIICTMSPARSHVEQSRNTLLFASCAKEVTTNAQVNVVMSDKALVKHLQRELSRLENSFRSAEPTSISLDTAALLRDKDLRIEKVMALDS